MYTFDARSCSSRLQNKHDEACEAGQGRAALVAGRPIMQYVVDTGLCMHDALCDTASGAVLVQDGAAPQCTYTYTYPHPCWC